MSVREPSTDPLKEYDITDIVNQKDNGPETLAAIEKYDEFRSALTNLLAKLKAAKEDAVETRTILAGDMSALHRKMFEEHLCGLDNEISETEAEVNNTTKAVIQLAMNVRVTAEDEKGARLLAILDRQKRNKAARDAADDGSASISSNQSTYTLRSGKGEFSVKAGSLPNGTGGGSVRHDGKPTPSKAENVPKEDGASRPKTPPMPSPPSVDTSSSFFEENENAPPVPPPATAGDAAEANPTAGTGGAPQSSTPRNVGDLGLTGLELGPTNEQASGANRNAPPAANANGAAAGAGIYALSAYTGGYPNVVGGGSALAVPEDETLTQTEGDFSVASPWAASANAALKRLVRLFAQTSFGAMAVPEFVKFVTDHFDDLFTFQTVGFSEKEVNENMSRILVVLFKHPDFATSEVVRALYSTLDTEVLELLPRQGGSHRRVHILPLLYRGSHCNGKSSVHTDLKKTYRKHGLQGTDVPTQLGSAKLRLMALFGILKPGFCDKSFTQEQVTNFLADEANRRRS